MKRVDIEDCELGDDMVLFEGVPFSGILFALHDDGIIAYEHEFRDGFPDGISKDWHQNGVLRREACFKWGRVDGLVKEYYPNGERMLEKEVEFGATVALQRWGEEGRLVEDWVVDLDSATGRYVERCRREVAELGSRLNVGSRPGED
ncbi:toxin-antitoxin system YwqK family antitoxin [Luteolibacter soli]|uniref:Antitoxin YwqK n=1 Tax=Luteolibacter soli TaxID=3135280 RepID=A0ABU9AQH1_9BACT